MVSIVLTVFQRLLQEAIEKLHAIIATQKSEFHDVKARADELDRINFILTDFIKKLQEDLGKTYVLKNVGIVEG